MEIQNDTDQAVDYTLDAGSPQKDPSWTRLEAGESTQVTVTESTTLRFRLANETSDIASTAVSSTTSCSRLVSSTTGYEVVHDGCGES